MFERIIYALIYLCLLFILYWIIIWVLGALGIALPPHVLQIAMVIGASDCHPDRYLLYFVRNELDINSLPVAKISIAISFHCVGLYARRMR